LIFITIRLKTISACATKHAVRAISEGLRQEVKPYNLRTTIISPGAVDTELPNHITHEASAEGIQGFYKHYAIPADSFARALAFLNGLAQDHPGTLLDHHHSVQQSAGQYRGELPPAVALCPPI
jgi:NAD(P)-dependent dehydrogenase (short-subunit alcohol dehydrogenase family)